MSGHAEDGQAPEELSRTAEVTDEKEIHTMQEAVIIDCLRTAVGKAPKGTLRNTRPDDLGGIVVRRY